jgi:hypothetical protein
MTSTNSNSPKVTVRLSHYPKFSGKTVDWTKFSELFVATAELQGLSDLLIEDKEHQEKLNQTLTIKRNALLYFPSLSIPVPVA